MTKKFWLAAALIAPLALHAQQQTGSIHGHAQDPAGTPLANAQIQVSIDRKTPLYTFNADQNGDYKGDNIKPGTYVVTMFIKGPNDANFKPVDRFESVKITPGPTPPRTSTSRVPTTSRSSRRKSRSSSPT